MHVRAVHRPIGRHCCPVSGDGTSIEGARDVQVSTRSNAGVRKCAVRGMFSYHQGIFFNYGAQVSYEASMQDLQNNIQEHLSALLMDPSSVVKRAVLHNISSM